jgi:hypothetical protein
MADGSTGVVEVRGVVAAVGVHVGDVSFGSDVGVEVTDVGKGLFPSVQSMKDSIWYTSGEVVESSLIKVDIVYASGGNLPGGVNKCMESFAGCEGEVEVSVDGGA